MIRLVTILLLTACLGSCCPKCVSAQAYGGGIAERGNTWWQSNGQAYQPTHQPTYRQVQYPGQYPNQTQLELEQQFRSTDKKVDGSIHYNSGRVADVPVGDSKLYCTLIVGTGYRNDPRQMQIIKWFSTDPRLIKLRNDTHFNVYGTDNPHYRERLMGYVGEAVPIVLIQRPPTQPGGGGKVLMNVTAVAIEKYNINSSGALADMVYDAIRKENPPPNFAGRTDDAIIEDQSGNYDGSSDCPPDGCPVEPNPFLVPQVNPQMPTIPEVIPSGGESEVVGAAFFVVMILGCVFGIVAFQNRKYKQVTVQDSFL